MDQAFGGSAASGKSVDPSAVEEEETRGFEVCLTYGVAQFLILAGRHSFLFRTAVAIFPRNTRTACILLVGIYICSLQTTQRTLRTGKKQRPANILAVQERVQWFVEIIVGVAQFLYSSLVSTFAVGW